MEIHDDGLGDSSLDLRNFWAESVSALNKGKELGPREHHYFQNHQVSLVHKQSNKLSHVSDSWSSCPRCP